MSAGIEEMASGGPGEELQSSTLNAEEIATLTGEEAPTEPTLPSDEAVFEMPEKFQGKSAEEIAKSYMELEKMKNQTKEEEGGDEVSKEEDEPEPPKEELTKEEAEQYQKYADSYEKNGSLSEEEYAELEKAGFSKEQVDEEIEYRNYKKEKALNDVLEPLGGGTEKFKEVSAWAAEAKTPEEIKAFNEALAGAPKLAQQALLKQLYSEFEKGNTSEDTTVHTNTKQTQPTKGYSTESEFFADLNNPAYKSDPNYNKKVTEKLSKTDTSSWTF